MLQDWDIGKVKNAINLIRTAMQVKTREIVLDRSQAQFAFQIHRLCLTDLDES